MRTFGNLFGLMGLVTNKLKHGGTPTGDGNLDFSLASGADTGLLALLDDM